MADFYNFINNCFTYIWTYKIQILGSLFLSLSFFEYFYRYKLTKRRKNQKQKIYEIKRELSIIKSMSKKINVNTHDIEHEMLKKMVEGIEEKLDISNKVTRMQISSEFEVVNIRLNIIENKSDTALAKIGVLEKDTDFIRFFKKYKTIFFLALLSLIGATNIEQIKTWLTKMIPW